MRLSRGVLLVPMRLPKLTSTAVLVLFAVSLAWVLLVFAAPYMVPSGTLTDLSGRVGYRDNTARLHNLSLIPHAIYDFGDVECHQIKERSYFLNGNQMPFCARDVAIFVGIAFGFGLMSFYRYKLHPALVLIGLVPIGIDGGLQVVTSYESTNPVRLVTGLIAGFVCALMLAHFLFVLQEDRSKTIGAKN